MAHPQPIHVVLQSLVEVEQLTAAVSWAVDVDKRGLNLLHGKGISVVRPAMTITFDILQNLTFEWRFTFMT